MKSKFQIVFVITQLFYFSQCTDNTGEKCNQIINNYDVNNSTNIVVQNSNPIFDSLVLLNQKQYIIYDLGYVYNVPVYSSMSFMFDCFDYEVQLSFNKLTEEMFSETIEKTTELINTTESGFSVGISSETKLSIVPDVLEESLKIQVGGFNNSIFSKTTKNSIIRTQQYLTQYSEGFSINIPISENKGFIKGRRYRASFYEKIRMFAMVEYDCPNDKSTSDNHFSYTTISLVDSEDKTLYIEQSDKNGEFIYNNEKTLDINVKRLIDDAKTRIVLNHSYKNRYLGTKTDPYLLFTYDDFYDFMYSSENSTGKYARLVSDLDFLKNRFNGSTLPPLNASLDCGNHVFSNVIVTKEYYDSICDCSCYGVFSIINKDASLTNLYLSNISINLAYSTLQAKSSTVYIGLFCGANYGIISNCYTDGLSTNGSIVYSDYNLSSNHLFCFGSICGMNTYFINNVHASKISIDFFLDSTCQLSTNAIWSADIYGGGLVGYISSGQVSNSTCINISFNLLVKTYIDELNIKVGYILGKKNIDTYLEDNRCENILNENCLVEHYDSITKKHISNEYISFNKIGYDDFFDY